MIKANELRIGNWVNSNYRKKYKQVTPSDLSTTADDGKIDYIEPIPLTPEILEKAGFNLQAQRQSIYLLGRLKIWIGSGNGCVAYLKHEDKDESYYIGAIQYLHQLQNLYFALTGKELQINL